MRKLNKTHVEDKSCIQDDTYLNNPPPFLWLEKYSFDKLAMDQLSHANRVGTKSTSLPLITYFLALKIVAISGLHPLRLSGLSLDDTTTELTVGQSYQ